MRIGVLADPVATPAGAELSLRALMEHAAGEVVPCPPGGVADDCDLYVVGNCVTYRRSDLRAMEGRSVVKRVADWWPHGDPEVRRLLLERASLLVFLSPPHARRFPFPREAREALCPSPVDLGRFRRAGAAQNGDRAGTCWLGSMDFWGAGINAACEWAEANGPVDFYGDGPLRPAGSPNVRCKGRVSYDQVPELLAGYERFVWLPSVAGTFGRSLVEAWAAGCELVTNRNAGALHWIEQDPEALEGAAGRFWRLVEETM